MSVCYAFLHLSYAVHFIVGFESVHLEFNLEAKWTDPELPKMLNKI